MPANAQSQPSSAAANASQAPSGVAEKSAAQTKQAFEKVTAAATEATDLMKNAYATTIKGAQEYNAKVLEFAHANTTAAFEYARQISGVRSPSELFALSSAYFQQQSEVLSRQAAELMAIVQKATVATTKPLNSGNKTGA